jgi:acyl-CoA synthetase (AMP-forming)/AMP-acid ligase II
LHVLDCVLGKKLADHPFQLFTHKLCHMSLTVHYRSLDAWNILSFAATSYPNKLAIEDGSRTATYSQLQQHCISLAAKLHALRATRGSRLAILHRNAAEVLALHFAAAALRAVVVNLNTALAPRELAYILADSGAEVVVASADFAPTLAAAAEAAAAGNGAGQQQLSVRAVVWTGTEGVEGAALPSVAGWSSSSYPVFPSSSGEALPSAAAAAAAEPEPQQEPEEEQPPLSGIMSAIRASLDEAREVEQRSAAATAPASPAAAPAAEREQQLLSSLLSDFHEDYGYHMYYTSGTTGRPKGVVLSHKIVVLHAIGTIMGEWW